MYYADIEPLITLQDTQLHLATPSHIRLMTFLYHIWQGNNYRTIANAFGLGRSTVYSCVRDIVFAILRYMYRTYIHLPSVEEGLQSSVAWERQTHIPGIIGIVNGMHITIYRPWNRD